MKRTLFIITCLAFFTNVAAQYEEAHEEGLWTLQPLAGVNISFLSPACSKSRTFPSGGMEFEYGITDNTGIAFRAMYSPQGGNRVKEDGSKDTYKIDYTTFRSTVKVYLFNEVNDMAVSFGALVGYYLYSKIPEEYAGLDVRRLTVGIPVGISLEYGSFVVNGEVTIPITKTFKDYGCRSINTQLTIGYKIGLN